MPKYETDLLLLSDLMVLLQAHRSDDVRGEFRYNTGNYRWDFLSYYLFGKPKMKMDSLDEPDF